MLPITRSLFVDLLRKTSSLLGREGHELQANATFHCVPTQRCNRPFCPLCQWVKAIDRSGFSQDIIVKAAADYEAALSRDLPLFSFTMTPAMDIPIQGLRGAADLMAKKFSRMIENRRKDVIGPLTLFETLPSTVAGESAETDRPHWHGVISFQDESAKALRGFRALPHFQKIDNLKSAGNWISYSCKSRPAPFAKSWEALLSQPSTFMSRISQMKNFQVSRSSGLFREARAA
jgi:hypothetical protein